MDIRTDRELVMRKTTMLEWLGLKQIPTWAAARPLGAIIGFALVGCGILAASLVFIAFVRLFHAVLTLGSGSDPSGETIRNLGLFLVAMLGAPFLVWRTVVAQRQAETADEALFNEKIRDAAAALSARREVTTPIQGGVGAGNQWQDDLLVRIAAIDRLEGLAEERPDAATRIERLLATYLRETFPAKSLSPIKDLEARKVPRSDLQAAISAIGKVHAALVARGEVDYRLNLRNCDFDWVDFSRLNFFAVDMTASRFNGAIFIHSNFDGALMVRCLLDYGRFYEADFTGVRFDGATHTRADTSHGGLQTFNMSKSMRGSSYIDANVSAILYFGADDGQFACTYGCANTIVSPEHEKYRPSKELSGSAVAARRKKQKNEPLSDDEIEAIREIERSPLKHWSAHSISEFAIPQRYNDFLITLNMQRWPYYQEW